jgi:hypothetical protein
MHGGHRYLSSLSSDCCPRAAPVALMAARPQDDRNHENRQGEKQQALLRHGHKDYHNWDANEDRSYQRYQTEHHQKRAFVQWNTRQQTVYWNWRHSNPDNR